MAKFIYTAKDKTGKTIKGELELSDKKHAVDVLREKGLLVLKLEEPKKSGVLFSFLSGVHGRKIGMDDLVIFTRQMATMTGAGITIVNSLETLQEQVDNERFKKILRDIRDAVNTGASLSEAMVKYTLVFSSYFVSMVKAGESSGMLEEALERVAVYMEKTNTLRKKMYSAMVYPAIVAGMAIVITLVMILKVIPVFKGMFAGFGAALPLPTLFLINLSDFVRKFFVLFIILIISAAVGIRSYLVTDKGRLRYDGFKLSVPVFGQLFRKVAISRFTRTLSTLVKSGVPILSALEIVAKTAGNLAVEKAIDNIKDSVREGESIAKPMEKSGVFPPIVTRMISVGEKSGELEIMLTKIADFYDEQVDTVVDGLASLIEPLIIAFLGIVVGGIVICMFLPIFRLSTLISF